MSESSRANLDYYGEADSTDYVKERYHRLRRAILRDAAENCVNRIGNSVVVELGPGSTPIMDSAILGKASFIAIDIANAQPPIGLGICADFSDGLPLAKSSVDCLVAGEVIEHIYDTKAFLTECHRVLKDHGVLLLSTPNLATIQDRIRLLVGRSPRQVSPMHAYLRFHIRPFTKQSLKATLVATGFSVDWVRSNLVVWRGRHRIEVRWLAVLLPGIGGSLIAQARSYP